MKDYINHKPQITRAEKRDLLGRFALDLAFGVIVMFVIVSMALIIYGLEVRT